MAARKGGKKAGTTKGAKRAGRKGASKRGAPKLPERNVKPDRIGDERPEPEHSINAE